jgi:hypothetical protein
VKLKVKLSRRQITVLVVAVLAVAALLMSRSRAADEAGGGGLDQAANRACADFAAGYPRARSTTSRLQLADKVMVSSQRTDNTPIARRAADLGGSADDGTAAWTSAAGALTAACRDAGWRP